MRDTNRIDEIIDRLKKVWKAFPDLRLGQLLLNVIKDPALYYMEDDKLLAALEAYYSKIKGTEND